VATSILFSAKVGFSAGNYNICVSSVSAKSARLVQLTLGIQHQAGLLALDAHVTLPERIDALGDGVYDELL